MDSYYQNFIERTGLEDMDKGVKVKVRKTVKNETEINLFCSPSPLCFFERPKVCESFSNTSPTFHVFSEVIENLSLENINDPVVTEPVNIESCTSMVPATFSLPSSVIYQSVESISENFYNNFVWADQFEWENEIQRLNREVFHNKNFKKVQREIINAVLSRKDVFAFLPTGAGKSLTYQLSSLLLEGVTVIIYPLIALINDQIDKMNRYSIKAMALDSDNLEDTRNVFDKVIEGSVKILCVTPERLMNSSSIKDLVRNLYTQNKINFFVIDEAHCILNWGKDFRIIYSKLDQLKVEYPDIPLLCLTGSINKPDMKKTIELLGIQPEVFISELNRPNLKYSVIPKISKNYDQLISIIKSRFMNQSGIIFYNNKKKSNFNSFSKNFTRL